MTEVPHQTIRRRSDEPKLELGDVVPIKEGVTGIVLARFIPSGLKRNEVHYIVEVQAHRKHKRVTNQKVTETVQPERN